MDRRWFLKGIASLPFVGVAATLATVASAPQVFATGGVVKGGGRYLIGEHVPEMIVPFRIDVSTRRAVDGDD